MKAVNSSRLDTKTRPADGTASASVASHGDSKRGWIVENARLQVRDQSAWRPLLYSRRPIAITIAMIALNTDRKIPPLTTRDTTGLLSERTT
ncbi:hypothetical protein FEP76_05996 [Burkholderia multivorans]|nr:hypothetical protein [Burkholderia multivorans]